MSGQFESSCIDIEDLFEDTPHRETTLIGPHRQDEELELNPENGNVSDIFMPSTSCILVCV